MNIIWSTPRVVVEADGPPKYIHTGVTPLANLWLAQHGQYASDVLSQVAASPAADIPVAMGQVHYVWIDDSDLAVLFIASANNERAPFPAREEWRFVLALRRERQMVEMELAG